MNFPSGPVSSPFGTPSGAARVYSRIGVITGKGSSSARLKLKRWYRLTFSANSSDALRRWLITRPEVLSSVNPSPAVRMNGADVDSARKSYVAMIVGLKPTAKRSRPWLPTPEKVRSRRSAPAQKPFAHCFDALMPSERSPSA